MSECKHETWNSVSAGLKWACGECGKFESDIINELRQQLVAEQAKRIAWELSAERSEATIAAMRSVIINAEWVGISQPSGFVRFCPVCRNVEQDGHKPDCPIPKALSNTAGAEYIKEREELKTERNKFQKELFALEDKYKQAYGWDKTAKDTAAHLQAAEDRLNKLEAALRLVLNRYHKLDTDTVKTIRKALGEANQ